MPRLLDNRIVGLSVADVATRSFAGSPPGSVLQVAADGQSLILGPAALIPGTAVTGPTGPGGGPQGETGPPGPATIQSVGLRYELFSTPGNFSWTVPSNVTHVIINAVGGGGGGDTSDPPGGEDSNQPNPGPSGQSGGSLRVSAEVTPGSLISGVVGTGGRGENLQLGNGSQLPGTATTVGGLISVNDDVGINSIVCNGGAAAGLAGVNTLEWWEPGSRASTIPVGLVSPFIAEYGVGGAGNIWAQNSENGKGGAVMIEWVSVT